MEQLASECAGYEPASLTASEASFAAQWQPIEAAPDHTWILLGHYLGKSRRWIVRIGKQEKGKWVAYPGQDRQSVTHWMPLPPPPPQ